MDFTFSNWVVTAHVNIVWFLALFAVMLLWHMATRRGGRY
jgi:hypothetical protein